MPSCGATDAQFLMKLDASRLWDPDKIGKKITGHTVNAGVKDLDKTHKKHSRKK